MVFAEWMQMVVDGVALKILGANIGELPECDRREAGIVFADFKARASAKRASAKTEQPTPRPARPVLSSLDCVDGCRILTREGEIDISHAGHQFIITGDNLHLRHLRDHHTH